MNKVTDLCRTVDQQIWDIFTTYPVPKSIFTIVSFCLCTIAKIPVVILVIPIVIMLDWAIRFFYAWKEHKISQEIGEITFTKVIAYSIVIISGYVLDQVFGSITMNTIPILHNFFTGHFAITQIICTFIVVNDIIRILETSDRLGVPIPDFVFKRLRKAQNMINKGEFSKKYQN